MLKLLITTSLLIEAIGFVESKNNPMVKDGKHNDVGVYQHTPIFVKQLQMWGYDYTLNDRRNTNKAANATAYYFTRQQSMECGIRKYNTGSCKKGNDYLAKVLQYIYYCKHQEKPKIYYCWTSL